MTLPTHGADFADAHRRHWEDAELLFAHARWANADQLYGYSAECGLKLVMESIGMAVDDMGVPAEREHRVHVQALWPQFIAFAGTRREGARYLALLPPDAPFADWSHHGRYAHRAHLGQSDASRHRDAANEVRQIVDLATEDGGL